MRLRVRATGGNAVVDRSPNGLAIVSYAAGVGAWAWYAESTAAWTTGTVLASVLAIGLLADSIAALRVRAVRRTYGQPRLDLSSAQLQPGDTVAAQISIPLHRDVESPVVHAEWLCIRQRAEVWGSASRGERSFVSSREPVQLTTTVDRPRGEIRLAGQLVIPVPSSAAGVETILALRIDAENAPGLTARFALPAPAMVAFERA